jgi:hypothetical protein
VISETLLIGIAGVGAYAASTSFEIELPNGGRVSPAVSFGPALAAATAYRSPGSPIVVFLAALVVQFLIVGVVRRELLSSVGHALGLGFSFSLGLAASRLPLRMRPNGRIELLLAVGVAALAYFETDLYIKVLSTTRRGLRKRLLLESMSAGIPLVVVLASTAGLIVVVLPFMGWATFLVMFVPVLATRHEFARWGRARRTYDETVRTLAGLAEGAGYVPQGHSARVAELCVRIGRELSLPAERLRELELVGLLHDVGAVSLPDPSDLTDVDPERVAQSTGYLLQETEYLAGYADVVLDVARGKPDLPLAGRILRVADAFESQRGPARRRLQLMAGSAFSEDAYVLAALKRVVSVS